MQKDTLGALGAAPFSTGTRPTLYKALGHQPAQGESLALNFLGKLPRFSHLKNGAREQAVPSGGCGS